MLRECVDFDPLNSKEGGEVVQCWHQTFAGNVKKSTGSRIHNRFRWHGFSYGFQIARAGDDALNAYKNQWPAAYVIFDEDIKWSYRCVSETYPDFTSFGADIYVAHHNMKWTMAFTHEQPDIGPFFAENPRL